jgi:membrane-associated phospholipid phosphatase
MLPPEPPLPRAAGGVTRRSLFQRALLVVLAVTGGMLALFCGQNDLAISLALRQPDAAWARFGERYGELPGFYAIAAAFVVAFLRATRPRGIRVAAALAAAVALVFALAVSYYRVLANPPGVALTSGALALAFALLWRLPSRVERTWAEQRGPLRAARVTLWLGLANLLFVHPLKLLWGRVRFRDLDATHAAFSAWYAPQGPTGHASFPSGHAAMAWMLLPSVLLFTRGTPARLAATLLVVAWGCFVALGRVVIGAHYASDVLCATLFSLAVVLYAASERGAAR